MASLERVRTTLTGFIGAPGVATMHCHDAATFRASLGTFWLGVRDFMPDSVILTVESSGDVFESTTGELTGSWSDGTDAILPGTETGVYAAPAGAVVNWQTSTVLGGKRLRGKTFLVPLAADHYETDGSILTGSLTTLRGHAATLVTATASNFTVWKRPVAPGSGGFGDVTGSTMPDMVAILRSRRG
jgi:hypothetical protein